MGGVIPPIVDVAWVRQRPGVVLADVRWYDDGREPALEYAAEHLPGAVRVDLERWLSGPASQAEGRHPLPDPEVFAEGMRQAGIGDADAVVGYDDAGGVMAARLVWMLRALDRPAALLDGGLQAWSGPHARGHEQRPRAAFTTRPWPAGLLADIDRVQALTAAGTRPAGPVGVLLDARPRERYAGQPDTLDPRAGHIPGARSLPCRENLDSDGRLLPVHLLRDRLAKVGVQPGGPPVISSCGSGVTACHTLLVLEHAGLPPGRLYPGSWSQWSRSTRPAATGDETR